MLIKLQTLLMLIFTFELFVEIFSPIIWLKDIWPKDKAWSYVDKNIDKMTVGKVFFDKMTLAQMVFSQATCSK